MKTKLLFISCLCLSSSVIAGGYRVSLQGQKALGMGHTGVAMSDGSEAVFFNPAAMVFVEAENEMSGGVTLIDSVVKYQNQDANVAAETDNPIGTPISYYLTQKADDNFAYGVGIYTPYGNTVKWPTDWAGSHLVNNIELQTIFIQPTLSFKLNDQYSLGFGPALVQGSVTFNRNLSTSLVDGNGDRSNVTLDASGITGYGVNIGFFAKPSDELNVGVSYRTKVELKANGESADFQNIADSFATTFPDTSFDASLVLPAELTVGISYAMDASTTFAFDINRAYWSAYKNLNVQFYNNAGLSVNPRNYSDSNIYRFGVQHILNDSLTLRAGLYLDESPVEAGYYTPETPRKDSIGYTAGASYKVDKTLELDFSLLILTFDEFNGSYDYYDQSGTTISFSGDYNSSVTSIGFGLNYKF